MADVDTKDALLKVEDLNVHFQGRAGAPWKKKEILRAVDGVSFTVKAGSTFGLIGESGCGKSTVALSILRLTHITSGSVTLLGERVDTAKGEELRRMRSEMQIIFQDPYSSLNPHLRAEKIIREPMELMKIGTPESRKKKVAELLHTVGLSPEQGRFFPHQFSGGQRQRLGIARALATEPKLIVCDEPVSALDVAIQAQILNLLRRLQEKLHLTYLFISHDMGVVQYMCDEIAVMYLGQIVEQGTRTKLFQNPRHPYTQALLSAVPTTVPRGERGAKKIQLEGDLPNPYDDLIGCPLYSRCPLAENICKEKNPQLLMVEQGHKVACHMVSTGASTFL